MKRQNCIMKSKNKNNNRDIKIRIMVNKVIIEVKEVIEVLINMEIKGIVEEIKVDSKIINRMKSIHTKLNQTKNWKQKSSKSNH